MTNVDLEPVPPRLPNVGDVDWGERLNECVRWLYYRHIENVADIERNRSDVAVLQGELAAARADIDANAASIANLNADVGAHHARLAEVETQAGINAANINHLGDRVTALENAS